MLGNDQEATEILKEIDSLDSSADPPDMLESIPLDSGMEYLEKAFEAGETSLPNIKYGPDFILL